MQPLNNKKIFGISGGRLCRGKNNKEVRKNGVHLAEPMNMAMPWYGCHLIETTGINFGGCRSVFTALQLGKPETTRQHPSKLNEPHEHNNQVDKCNRCKPGMGLHGAGLSI